MVFWGTVCGAFVVLTGTVEWLHRRRRGGVSHGRRSVEFESGAARGAAQSMSHNLVDGSPHGP